MYNQAQSKVAIEKIQLIKKKLRVLQGVNAQPRLSKRANKNTILRSPHVNKKARDQIVKYHYSYHELCDSKNSYKVTEGFSNNNSIKGDYNFFTREGIFFYLENEKIKVINRGSGIRFKSSVV